MQVFADVNCHSVNLSVCSLRCLLLPSLPALYPFAIRTYHASQVTEEEGAGLDRLDLFRIVCAFVFSSLFQTD